MSDPTSNIRGTIIESRKLSGQGIATTVLIKNGHLRVGDPIVAGTAYGFVRALINEWGQKVDIVNPSEPVRILGLSRAPHAGDIVIRTNNIHDARHIAEQRLHNYRQAQFMRVNKRITLENIDQEIKEGKVDRLNLIIKAEGSGELEALVSAIEEIKIDDGSEVGVTIIHKGVGNVSHNDVNLAEADDGIIIAFNVTTDQKINAQNVDIKKYNVIYEVTDDIEKALKGMLAPIEVEVTLGRAEVRQIFKSSKLGNIAGSIVKSGIIKRNANAKVFAIDDTGKEILLSDSQIIEGLKHFKDDVTEAKEGFECGIGLSNFDKIDEGNIIECFEIQKKSRG
jgi:translation initiation factor IF-2